MELEPTARRFTHGDGIGITIVDYVTDAEPLWYPNKTAGMWRYFEEYRAWPISGVKYGYWTDSTKFGLCWEEAAGL